MGRVERGNIKLRGDDGVVEVVGGDVIRVF